MIIRTTTIRVCLQIIAMFLLILVSSQAEAKGLLMLDSPIQYVDFTYQLQKSDSSTAQQLAPSYGLSVPFAILDPTFLTGNFGGSLSYSRNESTASGQSSASSLTGYQYNVNAVLLKETGAPTAFFATSTENTSQLDFAPASTATTNSSGVSGVIKNKMLFVSYSFRHYDIKSDTGDSFVETVQDSAHISLSNDLSNIMSTRVIASRQQTSNSGSLALANSIMDQSTLNLSNSLFLHNFSSKLGTLLSSLSYQTTTGSVPVDSFMITESYSTSLGKGLQLGASYSAGSTSTTLQTQQVRAGQAYVEHHLFSSLRTRLTGSFDDTTFSTGGTNSVTSGTALMIYTKKLPQDAVLTLEASDGVTVRDSKLNNTLQTQLNEQITVVNISQLYPLQNPRVTQIKEVRDNTGTQLYVTPADYDTQVIGQTTYITINPTGAIHTGGGISVTYEFQSDPSSKYSTNTISVGANYSLLKGKYLFHTQYNETSSTSSGGGPGSYVPTESKNFRVTARANLEDLILGAEYRYSDNFSARQDTIEEYVYYNKTVDRNIFGLQVGDSYNIYSATGTSGSSGEILANTFTIGGNWSRPLLLNGRMQLIMNYQMIRGTLPGRDYLSTRFNYDLPLGKFKLHLDAGSVVRIAESMPTTTNNYLLVSVRRYF